MHFIYLTNSLCLYKIIQLLYICTEIINSEFIHICRVYNYTFIHNIYTFMLYINKYLCIYFVKSSSLKKFSQLFYKMFKHFHVFMSL